MLSNIVLMYQEVLYMEKDIKGKKPFRYIEESDILPAYDYQKESGWTFNNEREVTETTLNNRINFLLLAYSLFINAYFTVKENNDRLTILVIGLLIIILLSFSIFKAYTRLRILVKIIRRLEEKDVLRFINKELKGNKLYKIVPHTITSILIPIVMILSFIIGLISNCLSK